VSGSKSYVSPCARFSPFAFSRAWPRGNFRFERIPRAYVEGTFGCFKVRVVQDMKGLMASNQLDFFSPGPSPTAHLANAPIATVIDMHISPKTIMTCKCDRLWYLFFFSLLHQSVAPPQLRAHLVAREESNQALGSQEAVDWIPGLPHF
jgi:hypothetical protein